MYSIYSTNTHTHTHTHTHTYIYSMVLAMLTFLRIFFNIMILRFLTVSQPVNKLVESSQNGFVRYVLLF